MTRRFQGTLAVICVVLLSPWAFASTPTLMNYQGILTNGSGVPQVGGPFSVTFSIYDDESATNPALWAEPQLLTTDSQGRFNILLGSLSPLSDAVFSGSNRWLGITVSPDISDLLPRTQIVTVAYAFRPATVDGAAGGTIDGSVVLEGGNLGLENSTPSTGSVLKNGTPFLHDYGSYNTLLGVNAGNFSMTGSSNTAVGSEGLYRNSTGYENTAIGDRALRNNTAGNLNTAVGRFALFNNLDGHQNTACGRESMFNNTSGSSNTAIGHNALANNTVGDSNAAVGEQTLWSNITGNFNCAVGTNALWHNTIGVANTACGTQALFNSDNGGTNTAIGYRALYSNTEGSNNTATGGSALGKNTNGDGNTANGIDALLNNSSGDNNTACGSTSLQGNTTGSDNTAVGFNSLRSNTDGVGNTAAGVHALQNNTTGVSNTAIGLSALNLTTTGGDNTACGYTALQTNTTGSKNTALGIGADVSSGNLTNATAIGAEAIVDGSNKIRLGNADVAIIEGQVAYTFTSDENSKENFQPVDGDEVLRKIRSMNLTSWNYKGHDPQQSRHYGPVAQEFFEAFGHDGVGTSGTPTTINSGDQAGILMIAVQTLSKRNQELESIVKELSARMERIEGSESSTQK